MYCPNKDCPDVRVSGEPGKHQGELGACPTCGTPLVLVLPEWARPDEDDGDESVDHVTIGTVTDGAVVPVIHSLLTAAGIRFLIRNDKAAVRIVIESTRAEEACEILSGPEIRWIRN